MMNTSRFARIAILIAIVTAAPLLIAQKVPDFSGEWKSKDGEWTMRVMQTAAEIRVENQRNGKPESNVTTYPFADQLKPLKGEKDTKFQGTAQWKDGELHLILVISPKKKYGVDLAPTTAEQMWTLDGDTLTAEKQAKGGFQMDKKTFIYVRDRGTDQSSQANKP